MDKLIIIPATSNKSIVTVETLMHMIWPEYVHSITGSDEEWIREHFASVVKKGLPGYVEKNSLYYLIKNIADEPIGYFIIIFKKNELVLEDISLTSDNRGKRYGARIMRFIEWLAIKNRCIKITTSIRNYNFKAIDFFLANKFNVYEKDDKYCKMEKILLDKNSLIVRELKRAVKDEEESKE